MKQQKFIRVLPLTSELLLFGQEFAFQHRIDQMVDLPNCVLGVAEVQQVGVDAHHAQKHALRCADVQVVRVVGVELAGGGSGILYIIYKTAFNYF